jgi:hypothetical protein
MTSWVSFALLLLTLSRSTSLNIQGWKLLVLSRVNMKKKRSWNRCWFYLFSPYLIYQWWCLASEGAVYQHVTGLAFIKFWSTIFVLVLKKRPIRTVYPTNTVFWLGRFWSLSITIILESFMIVRRVHLDLITHIVVTEIIYFANNFY